jgi:hypothetical protein
MNVKPILQSQYLAALDMLKQAVVQCPLEAWDDPRDKDKFWFVVYHALKFAHQYLKANDAGYRRWEQRPHADPGKPFTKEEILEKLAQVEKDVVEQIARMDLEEKTGATGALANQFELQIYNIRHIQHHAGELYQRLSAYPVHVGWASKRKNK